MCCDIYFREYFIIRRNEYPHQSTEADQKRPLKIQSQKDLPASLVQFYVWSETAPNQRCMVLMVFQTKGVVHSAVAIAANLLNVPETYTT